ncbi:putative phospholipid-transporting ATPase 9 isoform X2 [Camellia sinensis]|uniref:putative phospholipid-transporting ATPase 9 isoform X2 n=1 Tax=Camellia sinensis TaxID=4442 RepID=UPI001036F33B|nr:putative phospholipid-transporting ATPase 9 isoform X2 [Camellia sinensis]
MDFREEANRACMSPSPDIEVNNRKVKVHQSDGVFEHIEWKNLRVGDIVKVEKNEFFPADLLLLSSSYEDAICYVETMNLDGETNLKLKQELKVTSFLHDDFDFRDFKALVKCEDPNANLYSFVESMEFEEQRHPLTPKQLHLRDSKLRNTDYIYGAIIFTGLDTKLDVDFVQNDVRNLRWRGPIIDTIVMNPPFRTWKKGADMDFLFATLKTRNATGLVAPTIATGLGVLTHTLGTLVPVIGASGFATAAAATVIGTIVGGFR